MMGNDFDQVGWPRCGETDIMEFGHQDAFRNNTQERYFNGACHWGPSWQDHPNYALAHTEDYSLQDGEFHIYTCIWDENSIAMYVDLDKYPNKQPYYKMDIVDNQPNNDYYPGNYFHKENFILFNLAVGGNFPGIYNANGITALNDANGQEASMYVNYLKIYQKGVANESNFFLDPGDKETGIDGISAESDFELKFNGYSAHGNGARSIEAYDLSGRLVRSTENDSLSLEGLGHGAYILRATNAAGEARTAKISL